MSAPSTPTGFFVNVHSETKYSIFVNNILYTSIWLDLLNVYMSIFTKILHNLRTCTCKIFFGGEGGGELSYLNFVFPKKKCIWSNSSVLFQNMQLHLILHTYHLCPSLVITIGSVKWVFVVCDHLYIWVELSLCCRLYRWLCVRRYNRWNTPHIADSPRKMGADQNIHVGDSYFFKFLNFNSLLRLV